MVKSFIQAKVDGVLLFFLIASTNLFSFGQIDLKYYQYVHLAILGILVYVSCFNKKSLPRSYHVRSVLLLMFLPLASVYSCYVINGQDVGLSLVVYRMHLGWLLYFYLSKKRLPLDSIVKTVFVVGMGYCMITLLQQITYPIAPFGSRAIGSAYATDKIGGVERRMGFWRFMVGGLYYGVLALFFVVRSSVPYRKILFLLLFLSIVASGNRQTIFSVFISLVFYYAFSKNISNKWLIMLFTCVVCLFVYIFADSIFGRLTNVSGDLEDGRMPSYIFYWQEIIKSPMAFLLGNGLPNGASSYGMRADYYGDFHVTPSDIGIVGTMYYWGAIYVITYLLIMFRWLMNRRLSLFYKAILLSFLICSPIAGFLWEIEGFMLQGLLFYLCDREIYTQIDKK